LALDLLALQRGRRHEPPLALTEPLEHPGAGAVAERATEPLPALSFPALERAARVELLHPCAVLVERIGALRCAARRGRQHARQIVRCARRLATARRLNPRDLGGVALRLLLALRRDLSRTDARACGWGARGSLCLTHGDARGC